MNTQYRTPVEYKSIQQGMHGISNETHLPAKAGLLSRGEFFCVLWG
jgi:hypothetical protein